MGAMPVPLFIKMPLADDNHWGERIIFFEGMATGISQDAVHAPIHMQIWGTSTGTGGSSKKKKRMRI